MEVKSKALFIVGWLLPLLSLLLGTDNSQLGFPLKFVFYYPDPPLKHAYEVFLWKNLSGCLFRLDLYLGNVGLYYATLILLRHIVQTLKRKFTYMNHR